MVRILRGAHSATSEWAGCLPASSQGTTRTHPSLAARRRFTSPLLSGIGGAILFLFTRHAGEGPATANGLGKLSSTKTLSYGIRITSGWHSRLGCSRQPLGDLLSNRALAAGCLPALLDQSPCHAALQCCGARTATFCPSGCECWWGSAIACLHTPLCMGSPRALLAF